jgi:hypothetical protein
VDASVISSDVPPVEIQEKIEIGRVGRDSGVGDPQEVEGGVGSGEGGRDIRQIVKSKRGAKVTAKIGNV